MANMPEIKIPMVSMNDSEDALVAAAAECAGQASERAKYDPHGAAALLNAANGAFSAIAELLRAVKGEEPDGANVTKGAAQTAMDGNVHITVTSAAEAGQIVRKTLEEILALRRNPGRSPDVRNFSDKPTEEPPPAS